MKLEIKPRYVAGDETHYSTGSFDLTDEAAEQLKNDYKEYLEGKQHGDPGPQGGVYAHRKNGEERALFIEFDRVLLMF